MKVNDRSNAVLSVSTFSLTGYHSALWRGRYPLILRVKLGMVVLSVCKHSGDQGKVRDPMTGFVNPSEDLILDE